MDDDKDFYERLIAVPSCGPKTAEHIIGKLNGQKTLTETEQWFCSQVDPDRFSCPARFLPKDDSAVDKSSPQQDDIEVKDAIEKLIKKQNIQYCFLFAAIPLCVFLASVMPISWGHFFMACCVIFGSPALGWWLLRIEDKKFALRFRPEDFHSRASDEKDRLLPFSKQRIAKSAQENLRDEFKTLVTLACALVLGLWIGGYFYMHSGAFDASSWRPDDKPKSVMDDPEVKQFMRKNMRKGADGMYYYEPKK